LKVRPDALSDERYPQVIADLAQEERESRSVTLEASESPSDHAPPARSS
jgi:hypothetical protein